MNAYAANPRGDGGSMIRVTVPIILACLIVVFGCERRGQKKPPPPPIKVGTIMVEKGDIILSLHVSGTMKFNANTTVSSEVSAQVDSIEVADGRLVRKDQLLLVFDETKIKESANQARANLRKDQATLEFSKTEFEKNQELRKSGSISQTQYDEKLSAFQNAAAQVDVDRAVLAKAVEDLKKTKVLSPITGVLSRRFVEKGDWVSEGGKLFVISDYQTTYLEAFLSDVDLGKIPRKEVRDKGVDAEVTIDSLPGKRFTGRLTYVQPVADDSRLFQIRLYLDNPDMTLLQGMVGRARITYHVVKDLVRIPLEALLDQVRENDENTVVLVDGEQKAQLTRIRIGTTNERYAQVVSGIKAGERLVVEGKEILSSGQPLQTTDLAQWKAGADKSKEKNKNGKKPENAEAPSGHNEPKPPRQPTPSTS